MEQVKIAYVQWPDGLATEGRLWEGIRRNVDAARADILVTNEMPFGKWLPERAEYDEDAALRWVDLHEKALAALRTLQVASIISSRPVAFAGRLANEAFVLEHDCYRFIHHKQFFPQEPGFFEESWFDRGREGFEIVSVGDVRVGVLLCTELFFNEHARGYGRAGADLLVCPRASGASIHSWKAAGSLAAIVSGAHFVSSNRQGLGHFGQEFGGTGFAMTLDGVVTGETSAHAALAVATIDLARARAQKSEYPCYVRELH
jgi:N-carbamoylputrescine amidase